MAMASHWLPEKERGRLQTAALFGGEVGPVISLGFGGYLGHYLGWESIFYTSGGLGVAWFVLWTALMKSYPDKSWLVSNVELERIKKDAGEQLSKKKAFCVKQSPFFFQVNARKRTSPGLHSRRYSPPSPSSH